MATGNGNPDQVPDLQGRTNLALLGIIRDNFPSQYASRAPPLAEFRDAVSKHGGTEVDATLLADFRAHVPLSSYDSYKPFIDKFNAQPCKQEDVENMLSPGLPDYFAVSSATSGAKSKILAKYNHKARSNAPSLPAYDPNKEGTFAMMVCTEYRDVKTVESATGEAVREIPVCIFTGGHMRRNVGRYIDDESRLSSIVPGSAAPWAASVIGCFPSFMIIHGLFFLARRDVYLFHTPFATQFIDFVRHIDERWDELISCIRDGTLPDLEGIDHVRKYLQAHIHPDPERAAELLEIGPPFSSEGWFARVWPKASGLLTICSGPFATVVPRVKYILGPNATLRCTGYGSSETILGAQHSASKQDVFVLWCEDIVEFLDVTLNPDHGNVRQAWEVEVGKHYEPVLTTRDGLWRYLLGDVVYITGFHPENKSPLMKYVGRRSITMRFPFAQVTEYQMLAAMQVFDSDDTVLVQEFTTILDDRDLLPTVGIFVELAGPLGPNTHTVPQRLFDALVANNKELQVASGLGKWRLPTFRIVKAGTFAEYRQWKGESANIVSGQIKVPLVLLDPIVQAWFLERVLREL